MVSACVAGILVHLWPFALCSMHALCPPLSAPCLMSLALGGPVRFYLLFVPDIRCGFVALFLNVLPPSCVICCHLLHSGTLPCAQCMPSALHSLPPASCHCPWVVLFGFTFFLSQTAGVVLWHGFSMCCWPLALSVAIVAHLAICPVLSACPLPSTLCSLCGHVGCYLCCSTT